jgi:predicted metalloprotease with PDZ domain
MIDCRRSLVAVPIAALALAPLANAQHPLERAVDAVEIRYARSQPVLVYRLHIDSADLSGFDVELHIRNAPDTFRLAMFAHPEYDDRYWRFIDRLRIDSSGSGATIVREDSALWHVVAPGGHGIVRYRLRLPPSPPQRAAWRPVLTAEGGLVGGPHSFMYVVGASHAPAHVIVDVPAGWQIATGLEPTSDPQVFFTPTADVLMDSPMLVGRLRTWRFAIDGVPHRVVYWSPGGAAPFDSVAFVSDIERFARQAVALFGRPPYREYSFLLQDGAYGALEHLNSVTLGAPSSDLARRADAVIPEIAHEYFHAWNIMRIRPAEYREVDYYPPTPSSGLWWSEGATMYYADLLSRRAGVRAGDSTRVAHLEYLVDRYLASPGNARLSPEQVSRAAYATRPGTLGDYNASTHLQGELLSAMLDLVVRDATNGRRSLDDVMRAMLERFSGARGFTGADIEQTVAGVCGCAIHPFFERYVRRGGGIDFDAFLRLAGLRLTVHTEPVLDSGRPAPDLRLRAWLPPGESRLMLLLGDPGSAWGRAGLHTDDRLVAVEGVPIASVTDLRARLQPLRIGDRVVLDVLTPNGQAERRTVTVAGYERPVARIEELPDATPRQRTIRARWLGGAP